MVTTIPAASRRRLLYYNDSRHTYMYSYDPPMSLQEAWAPVDEVAGTSVDTFVYGSGAGPAVMHDSRVGEVWGRRFETFDSAWAWRAFENVKSLIDAGHDPLNLLIDRAHEKGMEFFASLRLNHPMDPTDVDNPFNWQFRMDHPEWCIRGKGEYAFNWVYPEVRAERFAYIEEYLTQYDIDGLELEFTFCPYYFEHGEGHANARIMTEYLRDVRALTDDVGRARGRRIEIGAKVLPTREGNLAQGLDAAAWVQEGLLDFIVPTIYQDRQIDPNLPFEWLVDLAEGTDCEVYPTLQRSIRGLDLAEDRVSPRALDLHAGLDYLRAGAASYWDRGANGIYLLFLKWPHGPEQRAIFTESHDPDLLRTKRKRYAARRNDYESAQFFDYSAVLPATLFEKSDRFSIGCILPAPDAPKCVYRTYAPYRTRDLSAPHDCVARMYVADDLGCAEAMLRLRVVWSSSLDDLTVKVNGKELPPASVRRTEMDAYLSAWLEASVPRDMLVHGWNDISLALNARPPELAGPIVWESAEIVVEHPTPSASFGMP